MITASKYHGCGNDFIIVDYEAVKQLDAGILAQNVCDRHTGIGADGLIIVKQNPLEMIFYNCDGSRAPMCGNGIRCFARYVYDMHICEQEQFDVVTLAGILSVNILQKDPFLVEIMMGQPDYDPAMIKTQPLQKIEDYPIEIDGTMYYLTSFFMGTIHTMVFVEHALDEQLEMVGKKLHDHPLFSEKTNVNFVQVVDEHQLYVRTYERGVGMTLACGTGCCASAVAAWKKGYTKNHVRVLLEKGFLDIRIEADETIYMSGPAQQVMKGAQIYDERFNSSISNTI